MIRAAERGGLLPRGGGGVVVEGSSGSTVIALAPLVVAAGHRLVAVLPDDASSEKVDQLRATPGVEVVVTRSSAISSPSHYVNVARRLAKELRDAGGQVVFTDQFETAANFAAHYEGTGREIVEQTAYVDAFVMSAGTGGTISGVSRRLKERDASTRVYLADPPGSALHARVRHGVCYASEQQERSLRRHRYDTIADGVGLDRVTANFRRGLVDDAFRVLDGEALLLAHYLLRFEGLFLGPSAAVNCVAALRVAAELRAAAEVRAEHAGAAEACARPIVVVTVLCDSGPRYLSRFWNRKFVEGRGLEWPPDDADELKRRVAKLLRRPADEPPKRAPTRRPAAE
ncbi:tryptophan synthase beta subunit-like PLP-dependent enzyme [Pelagophyceae sp. CCMP2097]|nr:tryptophan synthase beta subunit-like PLP-dependent enzyme [Pelagophyceae sp. CCMP2097]